MAGLTWLHGFYLLFCICVVMSMLMRKDTAVLCTFGVFLLGWLATGSMVTAVRSIFQVFMHTLDQLLGLILVISVIVAMSRILQKSGINESLVFPFTRLIQNPQQGFWMIGLTIFLFSCFFWPSPAVVLIGLFLLPAAVRVGIPPLVVAISMNLFGHGFALSGDYVIQGTPKLTSEAAKVPIELIIQESFSIVIVMGVVTTLVSFVLLQRAMNNGELTFETGQINLQKKEQFSDPQNSTQLPKGLRHFFAILVALAFLSNVWAMVFWDLQGEEAMALMMGTSLLTLMIIHMMIDYREAWKGTTKHLIEGFQFAFRIFTPVIPIASFFYLGGKLFFDIFGNLLPKGSHGLIFDLGFALSQIVTLIPEVGVLLITGIGIISGLDGSGYAGIALIGQLSHLFVDQVNDIAALSAFGQVVSIWIGGGTLVPWALLPAAAICGVDPLEVVRKNIVPVMVGIVVTGICVAIFL